MIKLNKDKINNTYYTDDNGYVWFRTNDNKDILYSSFDKILRAIFEENNNKLTENLNNLQNLNASDITIKEDNLYGS